MNNHNSILSQDFVVMDDAKSGKNVRNDRVRYFLSLSLSLLFYYFFLSISILSNYSLEFFSLLNRLQSEGEKKHF